jgi:hypothetical protein
MELGPSPVTVGIAGRGLGKGRRRMATSAQHDRRNHVATIPKGPFAPVGYTPCHMRLRSGRVPLLLAALAPASLVLSHDLSFLVSYGPWYRAVLAATGHGGRWTDAVAAVLLVSGLLAIVAAARLVALWSRARSLEARTGAGGGLPRSDYAGSLIRVWPWLLCITALLFVTQENLERLAQGMPLPGIGVLVGDTTVPPIAIIAAVSLSLSLLAALFTWSRATLVERIRAAIARRRRPAIASTTRPTAHHDLPSASRPALHHGRRAPPASAPAF